MTNLSLGNEPPVSIDQGAGCWVFLADVNAPLRREMFSSTAGHRKPIAGFVDGITRKHDVPTVTERLTGSRHMRRIFLYHSLPLKTTRLSIPLGLFLSLVCLWAVTGPFIITVRAQTADEYKTLQNTASVSRFALWFG